MALVGKKFPNLAVDAMSEMGDTYRINVLKEAVDNKKKVLLFWYRKISLSYVQQNYMHSRQH